MRFRLDVETPVGLESTRIQGRAGTVQAGNKPPSTFDPDTAILGMFPFEIVTRVVPGVNDVALLDHPSIAGVLQSLHRVTIELPAAAWHSEIKSRGTLAIDLYFDSTTHLLAKTVSSVLIPGARRVMVVSVVSYSDYRQVGTAVVPFHYSETLDGQPYRTLQLTAVQLNPSLPVDYFQPARTNQ